MKRYLKAAALCVTVLIPFLATHILMAEQKQAPPAPIPAQMLIAKRVFVANAGGDERLYDDPQFSGGADRAYNEFYAAMKTWGRFELVSAPAEADLLFEIRFSNVELGGANRLGSASFDPQFRLLIRDPKTNAVLWGLTEHVEWAILQGNRDKNFSQALADVVAEIRRVTKPSGSAADHAKQQ